MEQSIDAIPFVGPPLLGVIVLPYAVLVELLQPSGRRKSSDEPDVLKHVSFQLWNSDLTFCTAMNKYGESGHP